MRNYRITCLLMAVIMMLSSCNNFKKVTRETASQGQKLVKRKSKSGKKQFQYFVHFKNNVYQIKDVEVSSLLGGDFLTAKLENTNAEDIYTFHLMQRSYKKVNAPYKSHIDQVHYFLKDINRPLTTENKIHQHEIEYVEIYYKTIPRWILATCIPVTIIGVLGAMLWQWSKSWSLNMPAISFN